MAKSLAERDGGTRTIPRFKPGGTRQKRQVPAAREPPVQTAPGRGQSGHRRAAPFEERRAGWRRRRAKGGARPALHAPGFLGAPRRREQRTLRVPRQGPARAGPARSSLPQRRQTTHRSAERRCRGSLWPRSGPPPGAVLTRLGAAGAAGLRGGGGAGAGAGLQQLGSAGVSAAAASAGMRLCRFSLKCGASHSLTPASLRRRAAAAAGALPFLVAHSHTPSPLPPSPPPRARSGAPALLGRAHLPRLRRGSSSSSPTPSPTAATSVRLA